MTVQIRKTTLVLYVILLLSFFFVGWERWKDKMQILALQTQIQKKYVMGDVARTELKRARILLYECRRAHENP